MYAPFRYLVLLLAVCLPLSALAARDPAADRIGIYFDVTADESTVSVSPFALATVYIIVTNPTFPSVYGWEAAIRAQQSSIAWLAADIAGGAANAATLPELAVTYEVPLPTQSVTILATVSYLLVANTGPVCLALTGISNSATSSDLPLIWTEPARSIAIEPSLLHVNGVAASINDASVLHYRPHCEGVVATAEHSWGALKSLYR